MSGTLTEPAVDVLGKELSSKLIVKVMASALHEVVGHRVSVDVAFKRACRGRRVVTLKDRERLYKLVRGFVSDYIKLRCIYGGRASLSKLAREWLKGVSDEGLPKWCRLSYQDWFVKKLQKLLGIEEAQELLQAMNSRVWWLRINVLRAPAKQVLKELREEGVNYVIDEHFPYMVKVLDTPKPIRLLSPVKEFKAIPQDKASAAVVESLKPQEGDLILDMAFAPGMKTSLIQMLTENKARIIAVDVSYRRALLGRELLKKLGVDLGRVQVLSADSRFFRSQRRFDKVLLDAPCSNSGAISKDPGLKITLKEGKLLYYSEIQKQLLQKAIKLGDEVVYSTCSLMPEEGELVVSGIIDRVRFERTLPWSSVGYEVIPNYREVMRLFPHKHLSEGFFIAKIRAK